MAAPKGHPPYPGCEKGKGPWNKEGAPYGYLGRPETDWKPNELEELGKEIVEYMQRKDTIWYSGFLAKKGLTHKAWDRLKDYYGHILNPYAEIAAALQEEKLITFPFFKKADPNHAKLVLRQAHRERWLAILDELLKMQNQGAVGADIHKLIALASGVSPSESTPEEPSRPSMEAQESILDKG